MFRRSLIALVAALICVMTIDGQGTFKPRNADEEHAWRLYNQYKASKKKEADTKQAIQQVSGDIKTVAVGIAGGLAVDPADVARLTQLRQQLAAEGDMQQKLEAAWNKKFWGRYGDLSDSTSSIYDPKTRTTMDKIQFRLISFPFYVNDGVYVGSISGAAGSITLTVTGNVVKGTVKGVYKYTFGDQAYSDPYSGSITGTLSDSGALRGNTTGTVGGAAFTGTVSGTLSKGVISGTWTNKALTTASGTFTARKQ